MWKLIFKRILEAIPTLFVLVTLSFFMMRLAPGSPFTGEKIIRQKLWQILRRNII